MKNVKTVFLLLFIAFNISTNAQSLDSLTNKVVTLKSFSLYYKTKDYSIDFKNLILKSDEYISVFNHSSNTYNHYFNKGDGYMYSNSNIYYQGKSNPIINYFIENNAVLQDPFVRKNNNQYPVRDSFNPHGAKNIGQALLGGLIGTMFNK
jgi:hypothetical protein